MTDPLEEDVWDERRAFVERRQTGIGATDAAVVIGLHPWKGRVQLYHEKVDPPVVTEPSLPAWLGLKLEDTVAELYTTQEGLKLRNDARHHRDATRPYLVTHLDRRVVGQPKLLVELKTTAYQRGWGEQYTADVPVWHWCQAQHEMLVVGATQCDFAVLFGHRAFKVYHVPRDEEFLGRYVPAADEFWNSYVVPRVEPPLDETEYSRRLVAERHPEDTEPMKPAAPEQALLAEQLRRTLVNLSQVEGAAETLKTQLKAIIGDAAGLIGPFGEIRWQRTRDSPQIDWAAVALTYRKAVSVLRDEMPADMLAQLQAKTGTDLSDAAMDTFVGLYTLMKPGVRRFLTRWAEGS